MAAKFEAAAYNFRKKCPFVNKELLRWFPGHMNKGLKQMQRKLNSVDCVIEVHDSRIPFSGRNNVFNSTLIGAKPHILVLNKKDLTISSMIPKIKDKLKSEHNIQNIVFTNCKDQHCRGLKTLKPLMVDLIKASNRYNRSEELEYNVMIIGVPNVGKSSLINMMRSKYMNTRHVLPVGAVAGVTRSLQTKMKINYDPKIFMLDTPGILEPSVTNVEMGLKLALCASLQDHLVGEEIIADYLLYWLNNHSNFTYVDYMGLVEPCDDINKLIFNHFDEKITGIRSKRTDSKDYSAVDKSLTDHNFFTRMMRCVPVTVKITEYTTSTRSSKVFDDPVAVMCKNKVLISGAVKYNLIRRTRDYDNSMRDVPDLVEAARSMIKAFRTGQLGRTFLDVDMLALDKEVKEQKDRQMA